MKNQLIAFFFASLLLVAGCDTSSDMSLVKSSDLNSKIITVTDAHGLGFVKLRISSDSPTLLDSYTDKSFELTFEEPVLAVDESFSKSEPILQPVETLNVEIIETNIPESVKISYRNRSNARALAARWVSVNLFAFQPKNYIWVYNKTSNNATVTFAYNNSVTGGRWINATTKTIAARKDASYCNQAAKQIRATYTYDANGGSYDFFTWQYFKCP